MINTFFCQQERSGCFFFSYGVKICASGFHELLENIFCLRLVVEAFSLQKVVKVLEEPVVGWREVR